MSDQPLVTCDIPLDAPGFRCGALRIPHSHDRSAYGHVRVPIAVSCGPEAGPTVLLTGGSHGDEYEAPIALSRLVRRMREVTVRGRLIVIPVLNMPALANASRTSPADGANLNRCFPGRRGGNPAEMLAHYLTHTLFPQVDIAMDIHSGGQSLDYLPTLMVAFPPEPAQRERYRALVDAFAAPTAMVMDMLGEDRTFGAALTRLGKLFLCGEFGGHAACDPGHLSLLSDGLLRMLHACGVWPEAGPVPAAGKSGRLVAVQGAGHYAFATTRGMFEPAFRPGNLLPAGHPAGWIHDPDHPGAAPAEVRFDGGGLAMCVRALAQVEPGDCLGHLAADIPWP